MPHLITCNIKKVPGTPIGLSINQVEGKIVITKIVADGLVKKTAMREGMEVLSINGILCAGQTYSEAANVMRSAEGMLR